MPDLPSHVRDRVETKAAKIAERERGAQEAWVRLKSEERAREERTEGLKALRVAKERRS